MNYDIVISGLGIPRKHGVFIGKLKKTKTLRRILGQRTAHDREAQTAAADPEAPFETCPCGGDERGGGADNKYLLPQFRVQRSSNRSFGYFRPQRGIARRFECQRRAARWNPNCLKCSDLCFLLSIAL